MQITLPFRHISLGHIAEDDEEHYVVLPPEGIGINDSDCSFEESEEEESEEETNEEEETVTYIWDTLLEMMEKITLFCLL